MDILSSVSDLVNAHPVAAVGVPIAYAVISEVLPFLPTKANGIAQWLLLVLRSLKKK